jgi:hypothetical protein
VFHEERPPKRFHWGVVSARLRSDIFLTAYPQIYGERDQLELTFMRFGSAKTAETVRQYGSLREMPSRLILIELFEDAEHILNGQSGYLTVFCQWGGLIVFTSMKKEHSFTIEHTF